MKAAGPVRAVVEAQPFRHARRAQRHPPERCERQIELPRRRTRCIPVEEADQPVTVQDSRVVRGRVLVTYDQTGFHLSPDEPSLIRRWHEVGCHVVDASQPLADLGESHVGERPRWPGESAGGRFSGQVGEHLAALVVEPERPGGAVEAGILQMPQQRVHCRRPRRGLLVDDIADPHGTNGVAARQGLFAHW
jgi:hypothetical protein